MSTQALLCIPDARLRSLFALLLTDSDAQVTACHDVDELQSVMAARFYDVCVTTADAAADLESMIKTVRALSPETRLLLIANKDDVEQIIPLFSLGVSDVLLQPINPKKAIAVIQKLVAGRSSEMTEASGGPAGGGRAAELAETAYRPQHLVARSPLMRGVINQLWQARTEALGVILRGEPGSEFELVAREYQTMCGDSNGYVYVLGHHEVTSEGLATAASLDRLNDGVPRTFLLGDLARLPLSQQGQLLDFLRLAKRRRDRDRPLRFVFIVEDCDENGRALDLPLVEELLFVVPAIVKLPALRDRRMDIEPLARRLLLDLTALHPEYRARSISSGVANWLSGRLWKGNHAEFCAYLRQAIKECPGRELSLPYLTAREMTSAHQPAVDATPPPLTTTTSMNTMVATTIPSKATTSPFGARSGKLSAKELLATVRR